MICKKKFVTLDKRTFVKEATIFNYCLCFSSAAKESSVPQEALLVIASTLGRNFFVPEEAFANLSLMLKGRHIWSYPQINTFEKRRLRTK